MPNLSETKKEPELGSSNKNALQSKKADDTHEETNLTYSIIVGAIGAFLLPFFFIAIPYLVDNSDVNPIEALFLGGFALIMIRVLTGGVLGFLAGMILRRKKQSTVAFWAFVAGLFGGTIILLGFIVLSVQ